MSFLETEVHFSNSDTSSGSLGNSGQESNIIEVSRFFPLLDTDTSPSSKFSSEMRQMESRRSFSRKTSESVSKEPNPAQKEQTSSRALSELRRISGLTWDQLARLFSVSRRSVHFWASGKPLSAPNEEHLYELHGVVQRIRRNSASETRSVLFQSSLGKIPFNLLADRKYQEVWELVGEGTFKTEPVRGELSKEAREARRPIAPKNLVSTDYTPVHLNKEQARAVRTLRTKQRKNG